MTTARDLLRRQATWQKARRTLSWPEKLRQAVALRADLKAFRQATKRIRG